MMRNSEIIAKRLVEQSEKEMKDFAKRYPKDIGRLYNSYKVLKTQSVWTDEFLKGYLSCIGDLIIIKRGHWAD